jgi:multidrug efflux pump subunit AcrA (membrane-fusion protein)
MMKHSMMILIAFSLLSCGRRMETANAERQDITEMLYASGNLEAEGTYLLTAQTEGYVIQLNFNEGDVVTQNSVIALVKNEQSEVNAQSNKVLLDIARKNADTTAPQFLQVQSSIEAARSKVQFDQRQLNRYKDLYRANSVSKLEYENAELSLENSKANLISLEEQYENLLIQSRQQVVIQEQQFLVSKVNEQYTQVKVPVPGKIYEMHKMAGDYVRKGDVLATIGHPEVIYALLSIDESSIGKVRLNQPAYIRLNSHPQVYYQGQVNKIRPSFDDASQSFVVEVAFIDAMDFRMPGTQLEANIEVADKKGALVIPARFLGYGNQVINEDGQEVPLKTGIISSDWVEVLEGLSEGEKIKAIVR